MTESRIARVTGIGALACVALSWLQFPLWIIGEPPPMYDGEGFARHLFDIRTVALLRVLMDQGIYVGMMVFAAGFRHLVRHARPESEWLGTLTFGAAAVWLAVTLVADGLMGGAVLDTLRGDADASAVRALVMGTMLIYNGSTAFAITGLFLVSAAWATLDSGVLPRWTGWLAYIAATMCLISVPAMFSGAVDAAGFYNAGGWGPAIIANFPPADVVPSRRRHTDPRRSRRRACYRELRASPSRMTIDPLRLATLTSGPPPAIEPATFRLDTEPCTDAPMTLTDPDPLLASSVNGTEDPAAMSTLPDPVEVTQSRRGTP